MSDTKECVKCKNNKPFSEFYMTKSGYRGSCKTCYKAVQRARDNIYKIERAAAVPWIPVGSLIDTLNNKIGNCDDTSLLQTLMDKLHKLHHERMIEKTSSFRVRLNKSSLVNTNEQIIIGNLVYNLKISHNDVHVFYRKTALQIFITKNITAPSTETIIEWINSPLPDEPCDSDEFSGLENDLSDDEEITPTPTPAHYEAFRPVLSNIQDITIGLVYFILSPTYYDVGIEKVKIGFSCNLPSRLSTIQTSNPEEMIVYATIESINYKQLESFLHRALEHRHCRGEFYQLSLDEIDTIVNDFQNFGTIRQAFSKYLKGGDGSNVDRLFQTQEQRIAELEKTIERLKLALT